MRISQQWTQIRILHGALFASLAIYAAVVIAVAGQGAAPPPSTLKPAVMLPLFGVIAALELFVAVPFLRRKLMPRREPFPQGVDLDLEPDDALAVVLGQMRAALIVSWALCESVAILGLVAAFIFHVPLYYAPFAALAALAMVAYAPRRGLLDEVVRAARSGALRV